MTQDDKKTKMQEITERLADIENKLLYLDDEIKALAQNTLQKIKKMTSMDFDKLFK